MKRLALAALLCGAMLAGGQTPDPNGPGQRPGTGKSDWERKHELREFNEAEVALPAPPKGELLEFFVSSASSFRFFIDPQSVSVGDDGVVRYTLVARSRSGVENVSYEGIRCGNSNYRMYALAHESKWTRTQGEWNEIQSGNLRRWHAALAREYFCPHGVRVTSVAEALEYLRLGGHPDFRQRQLR